MASAALLATLALSTLCAAAAAPVTLTSLTPAKMTISVTSFMVEGHKMAGKLSKSADLDAPGIPTLQATVNSNTEKDAVLVGYSMPPAAVPGVTSTSLYACYSKPSAYDRPWRQANDILSKDKQCQIVIANGLPPHQGNATWEIDENVPQATYFVRAYSLCGQTRCAFGNSTGFFQVNPIHNLPKEVIGATIGVMFFGPVVLTVFFLKDRVIGKTR
ncbi:hypothetical protein WJX81_000981 [Elliptochloris bilobata]|uniref:High-affinity nitrate transporter n=1 Tax=Elliptochloris bilobata TaxID=381761 RepID=A0AAW1QWL8_9CHLO